MTRYQQHLHKVINSLEKIRDFTDFVATNPLEEEEFPYFEETVTSLAKHVDDFIVRLNRLDDDIEKYIQIINNETGDDKSDAISNYNKLMNRMEEVIIDANRTLYTLESPYFGKIKLNRYKKDTYQEKIFDVYLGKFGYMDKKTNKPLISDWRSPMANVYYQHSGIQDNITFTSPIGEFKADLKQKRQFETSEGRIHSIYDAKSGNAAADQFLLSQLNKRIGKKLADIVSTIQSQQNEIIREEVDKPLIIQGVAGSGKTTIVLHRLAYLFYTYADSIKPEKSLIIAPNMMFLDYISDVLPSLGVKGMEQNTYLFWARSLLGMKGNYIMSAVPDNLPISKFKGSDTFKTIIDRYLLEYEKSIFEGISGSVAYDIEERYYELKEKHASMSMVERLELSVEYAFAQTMFKDKKVGSFSWDVDAQNDKKRKIMQYIKSRTDVYKVYKELFSKKDVSSWVNFNDQSWESIATQSLKQLAGATAKTYGYKTEDLAPMVWIHLYIYGLSEYAKDHVVVDEAQDLSVFQLLTLVRISKKNNITIAGDTAQSIVPPFHISDWQILIDAIERSFGEDVDVKYHQLFRSYRTTVEIIEYANQIFKELFPKNYRLPEAVLRHGDPVEIIQSVDLIENGTQKDIDNLIKILNSEVEKGAASTAVITKSEFQAGKIFNLLNARSKEIGNNLVSFEQEDYSSGILVLPINKAKGLEFDSVIIVDVNEDNYSDNELDVRLLYVAITRTLHRLYITYSQGQKPSKLLLPTIKQ